MGPSIVDVSTPTPEQWQATWLACDFATFFHSPQWAHSWSKYTRGRVRPKPQLIHFSDGKQALLPLCFELKYAGLLSRYVSSPEATFGGWLAKDMLTTEHAGLLVNWLLKHQGKSLVWRLNPYDSQCLEASLLQGLEVRHDVTHVIRLEPGPESILRDLKNGYRSDIKKALKKGKITVRPATTLAEWQEYYSVYQDTLARWGHTSREGYGWRLFQVLFRLDSPHIKLWLARYDGKIVSGELCFYAKRNVVSWHAATLKEYLRSHVAKVQIFEIIKDAYQHGYTWFDLNPSAGLGGVRTFKEGFNAIPLPAPLVYVDSPLKHVVRKCAAALNLGYARLALTPLAEVVDADAVHQAARGNVPQSGVRSASGVGDTAEASTPSARESVLPEAAAS